MRPIGDAAGVVAVPELDVFGVGLALGVDMPRPGIGGGGLVVAGAEGAPGAGQDDDAHGAVGIGLVEGAVQLLFEAVRERVHPLGAVDRDGPNPPPPQKRNPFGPSFFLLFPSGLWVGPPRGLSLPRKTQEFKFLTHPGGRGRWGGGGGGGQPGVILFIFPFRASGRETFWPLFSLGHPR